MTLREKIESLKPKCSSLTSGVFHAGYEECKADVLAVLDEGSLLDELAKTAVASTSVACTSEPHVKTVELRFRELSEAHAFLDAIVKLGEYYQENITKGEP